jgi:hypothetical protein
VGNGKFIEENKMAPKKKLENISQKIKKINSLARAVDFILEEAMPNIFGDNIEEAYTHSKKQIDFFMRHIL